jgi:poly(A) polymerase
MDPAETTRATWRDDPTTHAVMTALGARDGQARFVGGCVRNTVLGLPVTDIDIDIATLHPPEETIRRLEAAGITAKPTGFIHGTITGILDGRPYEITTLRRDVETDGRHAVVAYTDDWAEDAARRDFTMNALFMDLDGGILDPVNGKPDAIGGRVRFVGAPERRIREDALRILRFFRFQAQYGREALDPDGLTACRRGAGLQINLSGERIRAELLKLLGARGAAAVARSMVDAGILAPIFPVEPNIDALERLIALEIELGPRFADGLRRLAVLLGPLDEANIERLRPSNAERDRLRALSADRLDPSMAPSALKIRLYKLGATRFTDAIIVTAAREHLASSAIRAALDIPRTWTAPRFPLRGADLIKLGLAPGERVGRILAGIEEHWISDGMRGDHGVCLSWARQAIEQDRDPS